MREDKAFVSAKMWHLLYETFDQLWKTAWQVRGWKWSLSGRLFRWEQWWRQMGQLNHCGNSIWVGWLWISGGHHVTLPMSVSCQRDLADRVLKSPLCRDPWERQVSGSSPKYTEHPTITKTAIKNRKVIPWKPDLIPSGGHTRVPH